jgi:hypothetical protein
MHGWGQRAHRCGLREGHCNGSQGITLEARLLGKVELLICSSNISSNNDACTSSRLCADLALLGFHTSHGSNNFKRQPSFAVGLT